MAQDQPAVLHQPHPVRSHQRPTRDLEHGFHRSTDHLGVHEQAHRERRPVPGRPVRIIHPRDQVHHPRRRVDLAADADDPALPLVPAAGELRPQQHTGSPVPQLAAERQVEEGELRVGYRQDDLGGVDGVDRCQRYAAVHELAAVDPLGAQPAGKRRPDRGPLEVQFGAPHVGERRLHLRPRLGQLGLAEHQGARLTVLSQFLPLFACDIGLGLLPGQPHSRLRERGAGARQRQLVVAPVEPQQDLAGIEEAAHLETLRRPDDRARDLRDQVGLGHRNDRPL